MLLDIGIILKNIGNKCMEKKIDANLNEKRVFNSLDVESKGYITKKYLINMLERQGILATDLRLSKVMEKLVKYNNTDHINLAQFIDITKHNFLLIEQALSGNLVIPNFENFCAIIKEIYEKTLANKGGKVADYIPQLLRVNPEFYAVSICTIDGQRLSLGDADKYFCLQSTCKPVNYCIAQQENGAEKVHQHIGKEPSGHGFNVIALNRQNLPHNPLINAGAIMACSLIRPDLDLADRFDHVMRTWNDLCGGIKEPRFNNSVYLSEKETADRNFALAHFMREKKAFPPNVNLHEVLDFYFQSCSIEMTAESVAVVASTLANAGVCPITQRRIFEPDIVKNALSLMSSCGLYDFSGEFAFSVGLPAKSGVSGAILVVIPNVMGICVWSPRIDQIGNSVRGVEFCKELVARFNFHNFDSLINTTSKIDPRRKKNESKLLGIMSLLWASSHGDLTEVQQLIASGVNPDEADYDGRTALHLAASEGQMNIVQYLVNKQVNINAVDRWGGTPLSDAKKHKHMKIVTFLEQIKKE